RGSRSGAFRCGGRKGWPGWLAFRRVSAGDCATLIRPLPPELTCLSILRFVTVPKIRPVRRKRWFGTDRWPSDITRTEWFLHAEMQVVDVVVSPVRVVG